MTKAPIKFILRTDAISMMLPGQPTPHMIRNDHPKFAEIVSALQKDDVAGVYDLLNPIQAFCNHHNGRMVIDNGQLLYDGEIIHSALQTKISELLDRDEDPSKFIRFMENLKLNPEQRAIDELYGFIETNTLPISEDGHMLAYKCVRPDFFDHYSGTVFYAPGETASMPREEVCNDPEQTCAPGLHICSVGYLKHHLFGGDFRSRLVLVKVNPRDVVSVPIDYANSKLRCCEMKVIAEFTVRTGKELAQVDAGVRKNLRALEKHIKLDEMALREIIGVEKPRDNLEDIGKFGDIVSFNHKGAEIGGYLLKAVLPSENLQESAQIAMMVLYQRFGELSNSDFILEEFEIKNSDKILSKKSESLVTRYILMGKTAFSHPVFGDFTTMEDMVAYAKNCEINAEDYPHCVSIKCKFFVKTIDDIF